MQRQEFSARYTKDYPFQNRPAKRFARQKDSSSLYHVLPTYRVCKYMGFALTKKEKLRRDRVMQKYKNIIK